MAMNPGPLRATPQLSALLAFERAAAHLSFRRAAEDLAISPSAVSHQIRALEEYFGVRLFARGSRPLALTAEGADYLGGVGEGLARLDEASRALLRRGRGGHAELRVSAIPYFTQAVILPVLDEFHARHPGLTLHVEATQGYGDVAGGEVDVAIRNGREHSAGLRFEPLVDVWLSPVMSADAAAGMARPQDILNHKLIEIRSWPRAWADWFAAAGVSGEPQGGVIKVDTVSDSLHAAELGLGVALGFFPALFARPTFGSALVAPFDITSGPSVIYLVTRPENARDRHVEAFRRWMFELAARLAPRGPELRPPASPNKGATIAEPRRRIVATQPG